jgi:hypothetical protein
MRYRSISVGIDSNELGILFKKLCFTPLLEFDQNIRILACLRVNPSEDGIDSATGQRKFLFDENLDVT